MGFTSTSSPGIDTFSNLINLMADPESVMNKLRELKEATDLNQKLLEVAGDTQKELKLQKENIEKKSLELEEKLKTLEEDKNTFDQTRKKFQDDLLKFDTTKKDHDKVYADKLDGCAKKFDELKLFEQTLKDKGDGLNKLRADFDKRSKKLDEREKDLVSLQVKADNLISLYQSKIDKLKEIL